jgi:hypothetical protein
MIAFSHTSLRQILVSCIAILTSGLAFADPVWCEGDDTIDGHPLNHEILRAELIASGSAGTRDSMVEFVGHRFEMAQARVGIVSNDSDQQYLNAYRHLLTENDGPEAFIFTHDPINEIAYLTITNENVDEFGYVDIEIDCTEAPDQLNEDRPTLVNIALTSHAIALFQQEILGKVLEPVVASIDQINMSHKNWLLDQGLRQWPWEMAINGLVYRRSPFNADAPRSQIVLFRPSAGLELQWESQSDASVDASVGIEPIGYVWYLGESTNYEKWIGVSALVTLGTNDSGAGIGGLVRYKNYWLGITDRDGEDGLFLFLGLDLHKYLTSDDGFRADLEARLEKLKE